MHIVINTKNSHIWASIDNHIPLLCHQRYCDNFKLAMNPANICWSWRRLQHVFSVTILRLPRRPGDVVKTSWRRLEDVLKTFLHDVSKISWKRLEDVLKTYGQDQFIGLDQDVLKTSSEDMRLRRTYSSWWRRLEDEDERRLQEVFKTSWSRRMFAGKLVKTFEISVSWLYKLN